MEFTTFGSGSHSVRALMPVLLDDASRLRVLHPDLYTNSHVIEKTCNTFRFKLQKFHNVRISNLLLHHSTCMHKIDGVLELLVKGLLAHVDEKSHRIEMARAHAMGTRNMMSAEVETRSEVLQDQRNIIADKQEQLERLNAELKSLVMVKQEQEVLIAHLSESSLLRL